MAALNDPASLSDQVQTLRSSAVVSRLGRSAMLRVEGSASMDVLDRLLPSDLYIRYRCARQSLLLNEDGRIEADLMLMADGDDVIVLGDGLDTGALADRIRAAVLPGEDVSVRPLDDHRVVDVDGPFAWQVLGDLAGEGAQTLRLMTWFKLDTDILCLRAGLAGEYGYSFLVPHDREAAFFERVWAAGAALDMVEAGREAMRHCRLESWFFDVNSVTAACPIEWGLQWRVQWDKRFRGAEALAARRAHTRRAVAFVADQAIAPGAVVRLDGDPIGEVARQSSLGSTTIGAALLQPFYAQAHVTDYVADGVPLRTVSAPFVRYRSLRGGAGRARYTRTT